MHNEKTHADPKARRKQTKVFASFFKKKSFFEKKNQKTFIRLAHALLLSTSPLPVLAQTVPADQIVVTATRVATPVEQIAGGVTIIDRATIEKFGYTDLVQVLADVPGLRVAQSGGPGSQASVFIRGTNSNQVLVLRDGVPINDPATPGGAFNFGDDSLNDVDHIEIVRGPLSSVYGSSAIGGVINLISAHPQQGLAGGLTLAGGSQSSGLLRGNLSGRDGIFDFAASAEATTTTGFDQTPKRESIYTGDPNGFRTKQGSFEIGVTPVDNTRVSLYVRGRDSESNFDEEIDANNAHGYDATAQARLGLTTTQWDGDWTSALYLSRLLDWRHYLVTLDPVDPTQTTENAHYTGTRTDLAWNNVVKLPDSGWLTQNAITANYEHANDTAKTSLDDNSYGYPYLASVNAHDHFDSFALGAQSLVGQRLTLSGQLREDLTSIAGDAFTWRAGGVVAVPEIHSHLKFSYGTGFRAPALFDRYGVDSDGYVGNPLLRPEYSHGWEAGITTDLPVPPDIGAASITATYFDNTLHDLIEVVYAPVYTSVNIDRARAKGVETQFSFRAAPWVAGDLTYTYTDARDLGTGNQLARRPYHQGGLRLRLNPIAAVTIAPEVLYTGSFIDYLTNDQGVGLGDGVSPAGTIVNLNLTWQVRDHLQLFAWGKNLTASRFEPVNGYQTPGRSILAGGRFTF
jgi:vitamin B12 transporter